MGSIIHTAAVHAFYFFFIPLTTMTTITAAAASITSKIGSIFASSPVFGTLTSGVSGSFGSPGFGVFG